MEGNILTPQGWVRGRLRVARGRIAAVDGAPANPKDNADPYVLPGFIDLHNMRTWDRHLHVYDPWSNLAPMPARDFPDAFRQRISDLSAQGYWVRYNDGKVAPNPATQACARSGSPIQIHTASMHLQGVYRWRIPPTRYAANEPPSMRSERHRVSERRTASDGYV